MLKSTFPGDLGTLGCSGEVHLDDQRLQTDSLSLNLEDLNKNRADCKTGESVM